MVQFAKLFGGTSSDASALAMAIDRIETERDVARKREQDLAEARVDALLMGDDAQIDSIEMDLASVQRQLDRFEVQLPELRKRHARQDAIENFAANSKKFDTLVAQRLAAARDIDGALIALGKVFEKFDAASEQLFELQTFYGTIVGPDGTGDVRRASPPHVIKATFLHAPAFARVFGAKTFTDPLKPFAEAETLFWTELQRKMKLRDPAAADDGADR